MNPATHGTEGSASAPVLYMALELSNKSSLPLDSLRSPRPSARRNCSSR